MGRRHDRRGRDHQSWAVAGIFDPKWLDWFDTMSDTCNDPWRDWLKCQRFPIAVHTKAPWLELDVRDLIKEADVLRLSIVPKTETFKAQFERFREHHENLESRGKYCRTRYMVWRAAALKAIWDCGSFQDCICRREARDTLLATMDYFACGVMIDIDGNYEGGNFWRPVWVNYSDGTQGYNSLGEYAAMVLVLMRQAIKQGVQVRL
jgi:hypothetical protein